MLICHTEPGHINMGGIGSEFVVALEFVVKFCAYFLFMAYIAVPAMLPELNSNRVLR